MGDPPYDNPLHDGNRITRPPEPITLVIFGATGDLTARKLLPAVFALAHQGLLPNQYHVVGFARRDWSHETFRDNMKQAISVHGRITPHGEHASVWEDFASNLFYVQGNFNDESSFEKLDEFLSERADELGVPDNRLYYLSAPPSFYDELVMCLGQSGMAADSDGGWRRIIIEKPFGHDLTSAQALNKTVNNVFNEQQVYRIDHYLGKETVQNILVMRFANAIYEPIWNRRYVDHVQISATETVGVGGRAGFYDEAGVVRDIFQNHILQVLSLIAMEPPIAFEADAIRDEKVKVLRAIRPVQPEEIPGATVRAQYGPGTIQGNVIPGYRDEDKVPSDSTTPTYAAFKWRIDNWRWQGVPFFVRAGKRLAARATEVSIHFKAPPHMMFDQHNGEELKSNVLALRIQPDEGISQRFEVKLPGQGMQRRSVTMDFRYRTSFGINEPPEAYERLLLDAMLGDATLFTRRDEIERAWALIDPILEGWQSEDTPPLETYEAGSWGPEGADNLIKSTGRSWHRL